MTAGPRRKIRVRAQLRNEVALGCLRLGSCKAAYLNRPLVPASATIPAAAKDKQHENDDDDQRRVVHDSLLVARQKSAPKSAGRQARSGIGPVNGTCLRQTMDNSRNGGWRSAPSGPPR